MSLSVSVAPEAVFHLGQTPINSSEIGAVVITLVFIILGIFAKTKFSLIPGRLQTTLELISEYLLEQLQNAFGSKDAARRFFPLLMSMLLFIFLANQLTVIPFLGQILFDGKVAVRTPTSQMTAPLAMAIVTLGTAHLLAIRISPLRYLGNFIKIQPLFKARSLSEFGNALLELFLGIMDIISEIAKLVSLSFRLFGNIFAGELIIAVIGGLSLYTQALVPIPFMVLSIFSGLIQAFVFAMLSVQFISGTIGSVAGQESNDEEGVVIGAPVAVRVRADN